MIRVILVALQGPNLFFTQTGCVLDVPIKSDQQALVDLWQKLTAKLLQALDWPAYEIAYRICNEGIRLALSAPADILLAACDVIDYTWKATCYEYIHQQSLPFDDEEKAKLKEAVESEKKFSLPRSICVSSKT